MPNRIIREGILSSDKVDLLDNAAEVFYRRLLSKVDDHGLFDARHAILRSALFPLRVDRVREADISRWIAACEKAGLIALYSHDGKPYLEVLNTQWQARSEPKFPRRDASANTCAQLQTTARLVVDAGVVANDVEQASPSAPAEPGSGKKQPAGSRLPADWKLPDPWREWAVATRRDLDVGLEADKFSDYWHGTAGAKGRKADWLATWRNWIRGAQVPRSPTGAPIVARQIAGNSPEAKDTPASKIAAEEAFCKQQVQMGFLTAEQAKDRVAKVREKYAR